MLGRLINDSKCDVLITKFGGQILELFSLLLVYIKLLNKVYICMKLESLDKPIEFKILKYLKNETLPKLDDKSLSLFFKAKLKLHTKHYRVYRSF